MLRVLSWGRFIQTALEIEKQPCDQSLQNTQIDSFYSRFLLDSFWLVLNRMEAFGRDLKLNQ